MVIFLDIFVFMYSPFSFIKIYSTCFVILFSSHWLISQEKNKIDFLDLEVQKKVNQYNSYPYFKKAGLFFIENNWDSTLVYSMRHLNTVKSIKDLNNFSHYFRGHSFNEKKMFQEAINEFQLIPQEFELYFIVKKRLAEIATEMSEYKKAIAYLEPLTHLSKNQYNYFEKSSVYQNLGVCHLYLGEFKKAEYYFFEDVKFNKQSKDTISLISSYTSISNLYYEQYKDDLAIPYFEKAYQISNKTNDTYLKSTTSLNMAVVEENRKNYKKALVYRKEYEKWTDSLNDQNKIYEVAKLEKEFAIKEKQKEVSLLKSENKAKINERNGLLYSALTLLILLGTAIYFYREKNKTNKIIIAQKEGLDELNATKDKLFSIVSHDLRSSVNALKTSNSNLLDSLEAKNLSALDSQLQNNSAIVNGAYNLLDNLLNWALLQTKQSYFEITSIRLFFIVEQIAYNYKPLMLEKTIEFNNKVKKTDLVLVDQESLKIILRNLIDNAIKFSETKGTINVYAESTNENYCNLIIEDSGIGMTEATRTELLKDAFKLSKKENENIVGTGLGLQLCKSMIEKNNGKFDIISKPGKGTKMIVSLPKAS